MGGAGLVALAVGTIMFYAGWTDRSPALIFKALLAGETLNSVTPRHTTHYGPLVAVGAATQQQPVSTGPAQQAVQGAENQQQAAQGAAGMSGNFQSIQQIFAQYGLTPPAGSQNWGPLQWEEYRLSIASSEGPLSTALGFAAGLQ